MTHVIRIWGSDGRWADVDVVAPTRSEAFRVVMAKHGCARVCEFYLNWRDVPALLCFGGCRGEKGCRLHIGPTTVTSASASGAP
jgi:hypothetical protein